MHKMNKIVTTIFFLLIANIALAQTNHPSLKTFGFDYGFPQNAEDLQWLATHHDAIVGAGDWQEKKMTEFQYDTLHAANPQVLLLPYVVSTAYTFDAMETFMRDYATTHGYEPEDLYLHYYFDNVVKTFSKCVAEGDGLGRCCDENGTLLKEGESSYYYLSRGYGGGTAKTLAEARTFQYWNSGFRPKMNHLSQAWKETYRAYILDVITVDASEKKYCDGVFVDSYALTLNKNGVAPNFNQFIELRNAGYGTDDQAARTYYAHEMAQAYGSFASWLQQQTGKEKIYVVPNMSEFTWIYGTMAFAMADQFGTPGFNMGAIEFFTRPSGTSYWTVKNYFKRFYDDVSNGMTWFNQSATVVDAATGRPYNVIAGLIAGFYLFNHPNEYFAFHYGSAGYYNKNPTWEVSHWHKLMEYDIGTPAVHNGLDLWGETGTDRMYVVEENREALRYVLAREYTKGLAIVRYDTYISWDDAGQDPRTYPLPGQYRQILEGNVLGPVIETITLGKGEGAILSKATQPPVTITISQPVVE